MNRIDLLTMKLLHYFITELNYKPIIVHGLDNEIWLENMDMDIKIVRINMKYIHNKEQLNFDTFKVKKLLKQIKLKTLTFRMKVLSFYLDLNDDIKLTDDDNFIRAKIKNERSFNSKNIIKYFPDISKKLVFNEKGEELLRKINTDILIKNNEETRKINDVFSVKKPIVTCLIILIMGILMVLMSIFGKGSMHVGTLYKFGAIVKNGNILRCIVSSFLHIGLIHFAINAWAIYTIGKSVESFYGKLKFIIIFLFSGIISNLFTMLFINETEIYAGSTGALFGLMGSLLYFSYNQKTYMSEALKRQILPVIILNLLIGVLLPGISLIAYIGGIISGILISNAVGIKYKTSKTEKINGSICSIILLAILIYINYFN